MADDQPDDSAVLSDVDDDEASPSAITSTVDSSATSDHRIRNLLSQLDQERRSRLAAEETLARREESLGRLKAFAQDVIKKRDDAVRDRDDALREKAELIKNRDEAVRQRDEALREKSELVMHRDEAVRQREEALKEKSEILNQKDTLKSEMEIAAQMMVRGIDKISAKISNFKNLVGTGLPRSQKYTTGLPAVAYGVIKRANEIVDELLKQMDGVSKSRDQAREQIEQRNYEIAIEVSELEATIGGLRDEVSKKEGEIERLERVVSERDAEISEMERVVLELREFGEERDGRLRSLEGKVDAWRPVVIDQLSNVFKMQEVVRKIWRVLDGEGGGEGSDFTFVWEDMDMDENLRVLSEETVGVYETVKVAMEKVSKELEERRREIEGLREKVEGLLAEKQHIGVLLRSALESKTSEVLQVAKDGLREVGIDLRFNGEVKTGTKEGVEDEVYTLVNTFNFCLYQKLDAVFQLMRNFGSFN